MPGLIITLCILLAIIACITYITIKVRNFTKKYFGTTSLKEAIDKSELTASETPKTVYSVESVFEKRARKDFPNINIATLKAKTEMAVREIYKGIEEKNPTLSENPYINNFIEDKIESNQDVRFEDLKFHNTVINMYEKNSYKATITMQTSFEYYEIKKEKRKKIQNRFKVYFIYVIDEDAFGKGITALGLHCPNCGAPVKVIGEQKICEYCGAGVKDITVSKIWILNNIRED